MGIWPSPKNIFLWSHNRNGAHLVFLSTEKKCRISKTNAAQILGKRNQIRVSRVEAEMMIQGKMGTEDVGGEEEEEPMEKD